MSLDCAMLICCQNQQSVNADVCWNKMFKSIYVDLCEGLMDASYSFVNRHD